MFHAQLLNADWRAVTVLGSSSCSNSAAVEPLLASPPSTAVEPRSHQPQHQQGAGQLARPTVDATGQVYTPNELLLLELNADELDAVIQSLQTALTA